MVYVPLFPPSIGTEHALSTRIRYCRQNSSQELPRRKYVVDCSLCKTGVLGVGRFRGQLSIAVTNSVTTPPFSFIHMVVVRRALLDTFWSPRTTVQQEFGHRGTFRTGYAHVDLVGKFRGRLLRLEGRLNDKAGVPYTE